MMTLKSIRFTITTICTTRNRFTKIMVYSKTNGIIVSIGLSTTLKLPTHNYMSYLPAFLLRYLLRRSPCLLHLIGFFLGVFYPSSLQTPTWKQLVHMINRFTLLYSTSIVYAVLSKTLNLLISSKN